MAETGSITAASAQLNVSQPTITVNIRNLERKHRVALFERTPRGMALTEYGSILYESARVMARLESRATEQIHQRRIQANQAIRVGCGHAWWPLFVRPAVWEVRSNTNAPIHVEAGSNLQCMWKLMAGDIAVSVGHKILNLDPAIGAQFVGLFKSVDGHFVAKDHPLVGETCTHADLEQLEEIDSVPIDHHYRKILTADAGGLMSDAEGAEPTYSSNSLITCVDMVNWSGGYTTFPMDMADRLLSFGLVPLTLSEAEPAKDIGLYYLSENQDQPRLMLMVNRLTEAAQKYCQTRPSGQEKSGV